MYYAWKNNSKRATMYRRQCRVIARGSMNSVLIEFENGQHEIVSRNAVRKVTDTPPGTQQEHTSLTSDSCAGKSVPHQD